MLNVRTFDIFLRTLQVRGDGALPGPAAPIAATTAVPRMGDQAAPRSRQADGDAANASRNAARAGSGDALRPQARANLASAIVDLSEDTVTAFLRQAADGPAQAKVSYALPTETPQAATTRSTGATRDASPLAARDGAVVPGPNAHSDVRAASLDVSPAARWLQRALAEPLPDEKSTVRPHAPLAANADAGVHVLAQALRSTIATSGLFYESHLASWAMQQYDLADLRREPQAAWTESLPIAAASSDAALPSSVAPASDPTGISTSTPVRVDANVDLVRAQLAALETRQVHWDGELWPGQHATISIAEEPDADADEEARAWRTTIALTLPRLGHVEARLYIAGKRLQLEVVADEPKSAAQLRNAQSDLIDAFEGRETSITALSIRSS